MSDAPTPTPDPADPATSIAPAADPVDQGYTLDPAVAGPNVAMSDDPLAPPDDFGQAVLDAMERRSEATIAATGDDDQNADSAGTTPGVDPATLDDPNTPPGGWPVKLDDEGKPIVVDEAAGDPAATPADPATAPAAGSDPAPDPAADGAADPVTTPSSGYTWSIPGADGAEQVATFSDDEVQRALSLAAWAEQLPDETRAAVAGIESGTMVPLARADYDQFQAWRNQQQAATRDADLQRLDVDPEVAQLISGMRDEIAQLKGQAPGAPIPGVAGQPQVDTSAIHANLDQTAAAFDAATNDYASSRGLSPDEAQALLLDAVNAGVIQPLMETATPRNPVTGAPLRAPDIATVAQQALDFALVRNPALHSRVLGGAGAPASTTSQAPAPAPAQLPATDPVHAKRARAASLASAPSAAVAPAPRSSASLSQQDRVAAMAADLEAALATS